MKIAQIAPIAERIPPKKYGGTERVIYHLTEELVKKGHEVTLFASADSITSAKLVSVIDKPLREKNEKDIYGFNTWSMLNMGLAYSMQKEFDIIHDHNPPMGLPTANVIRTPVVMTWHSPYDETFAHYFSILNRPKLVSISKSQAERAPGLNFIGTVYNGLPMEHFPFSPESEDYLLFVGRIDKEKGVHHAIDAAVKANKKLIIAAKADLTIPAIKKYFKNYIKPRLLKHKDLVQWIGEVEEDERNILMSKALALLHPVTWPEPFGLTLIEGMACGAPVIGFNMGSIPEIVVDGVTGYVVKNVNEMARAVGKLANIDRIACRKHALRNFSSKRMADGYEAVYKKMVGEYASVPAVSRALSQS